MTPFETFFAEKFPALLDTIENKPGILSSGSINDASWDRRAAYLLWSVLHNCAWEERCLKQWPLNKGHPMPPPTKAFMPSGADWVEVQVEAKTAGTRKLADIHVAQIDLEDVIAEAAAADNFEDLIG